MVNDIADGVKAKRSSLELIYGVRGRDDADKTGHSITGLGHQLKKLKEFIVSNLGKRKANTKIDEHPGMFGTDGELQQQKLNQFFG